jgi:site-specific DNA-cytosine methylase
MKGLVIDSFAGGGGASTGIAMAIGRDVDVAINHDPEAIAVHMANHPGTRHYCKNVWQADPETVVREAGGGPVALAWFSPDCFPAGSLVLTKSGYRPIEEIAVGDEVLTHRGRWRAVTETSSTVRSLLRIRGHGHPGLTVSPEHPILARRRLDVWSTEAPRGYRRTLEPQDWVPASMLERGWYWGSPTEFPAAEVPAVGGRGFAIDLRLFWLAGRYLGDGWTRYTASRAEIVITCGKHEIEGLRARLSVWPREGERAGAGELSWQGRETGTAYQFTANHRGLVEWLREHFGHRAEAKGIPAWLLGIAPALRQALLDGYMSADGWKGADFSECRTVSKSLAFGIRALVSSLGKTATVHLLENSNVIEGRTVNARPIYMLRWRHDADPAHTQTFREGRLEWCPIREQFDLPERAQVFNIGVEEDESYIVEGIAVHNCKHFSKAKGGKPVKRNIRDLAWIVILWAKRVRPAVIMLENVEEFQTWGPVDLEGHPCPDRKGQTFERWVGELRRLGYRVDWRELRACDYGAPTIRKRLFLVARCDGLPIVWPEPTHGPVGSGLLPLRTAADIIDWSIPCPSIFDRKKPLAEATLRRIAKGIVRYVLEAPRPFVVPITHSGDDRAHDSREPLRTITTAHRGEMALVAPHLTKFRNNSVGSGCDEPVHTVTANSFVKRPGGAAPIGLVGATLIQTGYGEREGQSPRVPGLDKPLGTVVAGGAKHALVAAFLAQHNTGLVGHDAREPISTIIGKGCTQAVVSSHLINLHGADRRMRGVDEPAPTITAGGMHAAEVRAFLLKYYGSEQDPRLEEPLHTATTKARFGLVTVEIEGEPYVIADIGMRMLTPRELFRAQGFPDSYVIDPIVSGKPLTKTAQIRLAGNSVCPDVAAALVRANMAASAAREAA